MRSAKAISVSLPPEQYRKAVRIARREKRSVSELMREALRRYEEDSASTAAARGALAKALTAVQQDAARKRTHGLTMRQINAEIAAVRKARKSRVAASA